MDNKQNTGQNRIIPATLCYLKRAGKTLMLHRNKRPDDHHAGKFNGLGGKCLPGETPEECVRREVEEESGLKPVKLRLHGEILFPAFTPGADWLVWLFTCREFTGEIQGCPEGTLHWIEDEKMPGLNLWPGDRIFLPWLEEDGTFEAEFVYRDGELESHSVRISNK